MTDNLLEIKPIQGTWKIPYVEIPESEVSDVDPQWLFNRFGGSTKVEYSYFNRIINAKHVTFRRIIIGGPPASPKLPYFFQFRKMPTVFFVGDQSDTSKIYILKLSERKN